MDKIQLRFEGLDDNAFNLLGAFRQAARRQGWSQEKITDVCTDYTHLVGTLLNHTESPPNTPSGVGDRQETGRGANPRSTDECGKGLTTRPLDSETKMTALAATFPSLANFPHVQPWDADSFDHWVSEATLSQSESMTALFLLAVWGPDEAWLSGRFDVMEALSLWDEHHRTAFLAWANDPWWP